MDFYIRITTVQDIEAELSVVSPFDEDEITDALKDAMEAAYGPETDAELDDEEDAGTGKVTGEVLREGVTWPEGWDDLTQVTITANIDGTDHELTVKQVQALADLECDDEAIFGAAYAEYSNDITSAISLVEGGYGVYKDQGEIIDGILESYDKTTVDFLRIYIDEDRLMRSISSDGNFHEMSDGRYIEWHR